MARGGARAGAGRKPGVVSQLTKDIQAMAREHAEAALKTLVDVAKEGETESGRVAAANSILDRAYGKPKQALDVDAAINGVVTVSYVTRPSAEVDEPSSPEDYETAE